MKEKTDTTKMGETSDAIKKNLDKIGMLVKDFRQIEETLLPIIKTLCEKIIDDPEINVNVSFNEDAGVLNSEEVLEIRIQLSMINCNFTCIYLDSLNDIQKMMGNIIPRIEARSNFLSLDFSCQALANAFGCNMENWDFE